MRNLFFLSFISLLSFIDFTHAQTTETLFLRPGPEVGIDAEVRTDMDWPIWYEDDFIANAWTVQGNPFVQRSLIKFDLSALPANANVVSAKLSLYCNTSSGHHQLHSGNNSCSLLKIIEPWDQYQVTWNTQPNTTYEDSVVLQKTTYMVQDYTDIDITNMIRYFHQHPDENFGFMIQLIEELQLSAMVFSSSNHVDSTKRPSLTIQYDFCQSPDAAFKFVKLNNSNLVQFVIDSVDNANYWWDFGNGYYSTGGSPLFFYNIPGQYQVCLKVSNNCSENEFCDSIEICTEQISGSFNYKVLENQVSFEPITFHDKVDFFWDFGDGFFSNLDEPIHHYQESGYYNVCLYANNFCNQLIHCDTIYFNNIDNKPKNENIVNVYPNPSNGIVQINSEIINSNFKHIRIVNFNGTEILNENHYRLSKNAEGYSCDLRGMETGIYTVQVITDNGIYIQKAVIVKE